MYGHVTRMLSVNKFIEGYITLGYILKGLFRLQIHVMTTKLSYIVMYKEVPRATLWFHLFGLMLPLQESYET